MLLFVFLSFLLYSLTVRNELCPDEVQTWLSYKEEVEKADSPGKVHCKCRAAPWAGFPELCVCWVLEGRLMVSLKGTHRDFISLQCECTTLWHLLASLPHVPASSCLSETRRSDVLPAWGSLNFPKTQACGY